VVAWSVERLAELCLFVSGIGSKQFACRVALTLQRQGLVSLVAESRQAISGGL
jgi:hypothetical protein